MEFQRVKQSDEFILIRVGDFAGFVTRYHFQMAINYKYALGNADTWRDFRLICGPDLCNYMSVFLEWDEREPRDTDLISHLREDIWVLNDPDFPLLQFLEETTTFHGKKFALEDPALRVETEWGNHVDLYSLESAENLLSHAREKGLKVESVNFSFN